ncbi:hypothetical protein, partial [Alistipes shahii]|uniref:hypothetical protein n=1 Tax=Alistipes shahii TaxID=328814 RepID=UPI003FD7EF3B
FYCSEHMQNRELNTCKQDIYSFLRFSFPTKPEPMIRSAVFLRQPGGGKVSPQGRKFVHDLRIAGAGRIERATRRGKTGGTEAAARTGSGNRESPEQRRGNGPAADSGPAVRGTSGIFRRDAVLN